MEKKRMDNLLYYEVYNKCGELVTEGDIATIAERLNLSVKHVQNAVSRGEYKGLEYVLVGKLRRIFDCYEGAQYVTTGTYEEIAEHTGNALTTVKYGSNPSAHKRGDGRAKETNMLLLYEREDREARYL